MPGQFISQSEIRIILSELMPLMTAEEQEGAEHLARILRRADATGHTLGIEKRDAIGPTVSLLTLAPTPSFRYGTLVLARALLPDYRVEDLFQAWEIRLKSACNDTVLMR